MMSASGTKTCAYCGTQADARAITCPNCGGNHFKPTTSADPSPRDGELPPPTRSKIVAVALWSLLGWLGVHSFYLGHVCRGWIALGLICAFVVAGVSFDAVPTTGYGGLALLASIALTLTACAIPIYWLWTGALILHAAITGEPYAAQKPTKDTRRG